MLRLSSDQKHGKHAAMYGVLSRLVFFLPPGTFGAIYVSPSFGASVDGTGLRAVCQLCFDKQLCRFRIDIARNFYLVLGV